MITNDPRSRVPRLSLLARLAAASIAALALVGAALFFGIDYFVSGQFARLRKADSERLAQEVRRMAAAEQRRIAGLAMLLARDADLNHGTYYHLYLAGEREHPRAVVERIAAAFDLESVTLWDLTETLLAAQPESPIPGAPALATSAAQGRFVRAADGSAWLVADAPLLRGGEAMATLRLARPVERLLATWTLAPGSSALKVAEGAAAPGVIRIALDDAATVSVDLLLADTVGEALADVKVLLAVTLAGSGVLLAGGVGLYLRRQLAPLNALASAAAAVGRGDFTQRVTGGGAAEVVQLATAFNRMIAELSKLRDVERRLAHQEQLSAIGRVAARVAHDIANPLTVIGTTARLALKQLPAAGKLASELQRIVHHCDRCMRTVENLLDYGRPIRLKPARLEVCAVVRDLVPRWGAIFRAGGETWIDADRLQLEAMIENLLSNARDAAGHEGTVVVAASTDGESAIVEVIDDGPGFSESSRAHLFEPFFSDKPGGTGLGLASALAIARAHGGDIRVMPGSHGHVVVRLPLANSDSAVGRACAVAGFLRRYRNQAAGDDGPSGRTVEEVEELRHAPEISGAEHQR